MEKEISDIKKFDKFAVGGHSYYSMFDGIWGYDADVGICLSNALALCSEDGGVIK